MSKITCKYHSDRTAVSKCEKCGAYICLECKNIFNRYNSGSYSSHTGGYSVRCELCPECFADMVKSSNNPTKCFFMACGLFIFIIFAFSIFSSMNSHIPSYMQSQSQSFFGPFIGIFIIMICAIAGIMGYKFMIKGPEENENATKIKERALLSKSFEKSPNYSDLSRNLKPTIDKSHCHKCGAKLDPEMNFCGHCGNAIDS